MSEIASIVSTIGFPIASFLLSAYFIKYSILPAHGYVENGIAGNGFADMISKELERK